MRSRGPTVSLSGAIARSPGAEPGSSRDPSRWRLAAEYSLAGVLLVGLLLVWQAAVWVWSVPKWLLPGPLDIGLTLVTDRELIVTHVGRTIQETLIGFSVAFVVGVSFAFAMDAWPTARRALYPPLIASQTIPIIAIAPLLVIWFGYDLAPKITVVALICFFPIVVSTIDGLSGVDPDYANLVRAMGGSERDVFWRVRLPGALPAIFSGAKIAVTYSVIGAIVGEWVGASRGIGIYMVRAADQMLTERVFAAIVLSSLLSIALFLIVAGVERAALPWHRARPRRSGHRR
jgi:ABC-type nitrate/sulfonate/bicarbonate transport system permease component